MADNLELLRIAVAQLGDLAKRFVFAGGCVTGLLISDEASAAQRPTTDVDGIVEVLTYPQLINFEAQLEERGFRRAIDGPICRWEKEELLLDVMPVNGELFGFNSRWFPEAVASADIREIAPKISIRVVTPIYFLATKLEAFSDRGKNDFLGSRDLEDVVALVNGREELVDEIRVSDSEVKSFITKSFGNLLKKPPFLEAIPGHLNPEPDRIIIVMERLTKISEI